MTIMKNANIQNDEGGEGAVTEVSVIKRLRVICEMKELRTKTMRFVKRQALL